MLRIAVLADIHGNLPALEAVLDDIAQQGFDEVLHAGDLIGRGPQGNAVVEHIRAAGIPGIRGNHEDFVLEVRDGGTSALVSGTPAERMYAPCARWMADELDDASAAFVRDLPFARLSRSDERVLVVHGSPRSNREGIGPWTDDANLREILSGVDAAVMACAHTHRPLVRQSEGRLVVNVGSVGLSFDGDPRASYAILSRRAGVWSAEIRRLDYDRDAFLEVYRTSGFLESGGTMARALEHEVRTARSHLVPFITWAELEDRTPDDAAFDEFTAFYDPRWGVRELRRRAGVSAPV